MGLYFTDVGPVRGTVLYHSDQGTASIFGAPDDPEPIGEAHCTHCTAVGFVALWELSIRRRELPGRCRLPGRWVIKDRVLRPAR